MTLDARVPEDPSEEGGRPRDAANTRRLLLEAARHRFALDGYGSTTSRDIAAEAGVNVALINRYFGSKEGLFEACLARTGEQLVHEEQPTPSLDRLVQSLIEQATLPAAGAKPLQLLLLLRSSGDDRADEIRRRTMRSYTERIAAIIGWDAGDPATAPLLLRAQAAMALGFGIVIMRSSAGLEPLRSASPDDLDAPLRDALHALLAAPHD